MRGKLVLVVLLLCIVSYIQAQAQECPASFTLSTRVAATTSSKIGLVFSVTNTGYSCTYCYANGNACAAGSNPSQPISMGSVNGGAAVTFPPASSNINLDGNSQYYISCTCGSATAAVTQFTKPSAPTVTATATVSSITLSWNAVTGTGTIRRYRVCTSSNTCVNLEGATFATTYTITGLNPATSYNFLVSAQSNELSTSWGEEGLANNIVTLIGAPTSVTVNSASINNVDVSWSMASYSSIGSDFVRYDICLNPGNMCQPVTSKTATSVSYSSGLSNNVAYTATVTAVSNRNGASTTSDPDYTPPAPLVISQQVNLATATSVTIEWTDSSNTASAINYKVCTYLNGCSLNTVTSPHTIINLPASNSVYTDYFIRSTSANSGKFVDTPFIITSGPGEVTEFYSTGRTTTSLDFGWSVPDGGYDLVVSYEVCCSGNCQTTTDTAISFTGLSQNTVYSCTIQSSTSVGTGPVSTAKSFSVTPTTVTNFAQTAALATSTSFGLSWTPVSAGTPSSGDFTYTICKSGYVDCVTTKSSSITYSAGTMNGNTAYTMVIFVTDNYSEVSDIVTTTGITAPNTPATVSNVSRSSNSLGLSWTPSPLGAQIITYEICCSDSFSSTCATTTTTSITLNTNLDSATVYSCTNQAKNNVGSSPVSASTPQRTSPAAVSGLRQNDVTAFGVILEWNPVATGLPSSGPFTYKVCLPDETSCTTASGSLIQSYSGLSPDTQYTLEVYALDTLGIKSAVSTIDITTLPNGVTSLVGGTRTTSSIAFSWNALTSQSGLTYTYTVCCAAGTATPICQSPTSNTFLTFTGLSATTVYDCTISSATELGNGPTGSVQQFSTLPSTPTNFASSTVSSNQLQLSWTSITGGSPSSGAIPSGTFNYKVCIASTLTCSTTTGSSLVFTHASLTPNTQYTFNLVAVDRFLQESTPTSVIGITGPDTPSTLTRDSSTSSSITFSWLASPVGALPITYRICCKDNVGGDDCTETSTMTSITLNSLPAGTVYTCTNQARTSAKDSLVSAATIARTTPNAPTNLQQTGISFTTVSLSWSAVTGGVPTTEPYEYKVCKSGGIDCVSTAGTSITYTSLSHNTIYTMEVYTRDINGNLESTATTLTTSATLPNGIDGNPTLTGRTQTSLSLEWNTPLGGSALSYSYRLCCSGICVSSITTTSYTMTGLSQSSLYYCSVTVSTSAGVATAVNGASFSTIPASVTNLDVNSITTTSFDLTWNTITAGSPSSGDYYYQICKYVTWWQFPEYDCVNTPIGANSIHYTTSITGNTYYLMSVRTVDSQGVKSDPTMIGVTTLPNGVTSITKSSVSTNSFSFSWNNPIGGTALPYSFWLCCDNADTLLCKLTSQLNVVMDGLAPNTLYSCQMRTSTSLATAPLSTAQGMRTLPSTPTAGTFSTQSNRSFLLNWNAIIPGNPSSGNYQYEICKPGRVGCVTTASTSTPYMDSSFVGNTAYAMQIRSVDVEGQYSSPLYINAITAPDVPSSLTITDQSSTSLSLIWTATQASASQITYEICCTNTVGEVCDTTTSNSITMTNLQAGTLYSCKNRAITDYGISDYTTVQPFATEPNTVASITQDAITSSTVTLSWQPVTGGTPTTAPYSYKVCQSNQIVTCQTTTTTSITYTGLTANTIYTLEVYAIDTVHMVSSAMTTVTTSATLPNAVTSFSSSARTDSSITLDWATPSGGNALTYTYQACCQDTTKGTTCDSITAQNSITLQDLPSSTLYTCSITASTNAGSALTSITQQYRTFPTKPVINSQPPNSATINSFGISWSAMVEGNPTSGPFTTKVCKENYVDCIAVPSNQNSIIYTIDLEPNTMYSMIVQVFDQEGQSTTSDPVHYATTPGAAGPLSVSTRTETTLTLSWTAPLNDNNAHPVSYSICLRDNSQCYGVTATLSVTFVGLTVGTKYDFVIQTGSIVGVGLSSTNQQQLFATLPPKPSGFIATTKTTNQINLQWNPVVGTTGTYKYRVCRQGGVSCTTPSLMTTVNYSTGLQANTAYILEVQSQDAEGIYSLATTLTTGTAPPATSIIAKASANSNQISFTWIPITTGSLSVSYVACVNSLTCVTVSGTTATFNSLASNTNYAISVYAQNSHASGVVVSDSVKTRSRPVLNLTSTQRTPTSIKLTWSLPNNDGTTVALQYRVCDVNVMSSCQIISARELVLTNLIDSNNYLFSVEALNTAMEYSTPEMITTNTLPLTPSGFTTTATTVHSIVLSWNIPPTNGNWKSLTYTICLEDTNSCQTTSDNLAMFHNLAHSSFYDFTLVANNGQDDSIATTLRASTRPPSPNLFEASVRTDTSILLTWNETSSSTYDVCCVECNTCIQNVGIDSYTFVQLQPNTLYHFNLTETNIHGSNYSLLEASTIPNTPNLLAVDYTSANRIDFIWSSFTQGNIPFIKLSLCSSYSLNNNNTEECLISNNGQLTQGSVMTLLSSHTQEYTLQVLNQRGDVSVPISIMASTLPPSIMNVTLISSTNSSVTVAWNSITLNDIGNDNMNIIYTVCLDSMTCLSELSMETNQVTFTQGVMSSNLYNLNIVATNQRKLTSTPTYLMIDTLPSAPILSFVSSTRHTIMIQLDPSSVSGNVPLRNYIIRLDGKEIANVLSSMYWQYELNQLMAGTEYLVSVQLDNERDQLSVINSQLMKTQEPIVPVYPVITGASTSYNTIQLNWTTPIYDGGRPIINYQVTYYPTLNMVSPVVQSLETISDETTIEITNVIAGTNYTVEVVAINRVGSSLPSMITVMTIPPIIPDSIVQLQVTNIKQRTATISWNEPIFVGGTPILYYQLNITGPTGNDAVTVVTQSFLLDSKVNELNITNLVGSSNYTVMITAINMVGAAQTSKIPFETLQSVSPQGPSSVVILELTHNKVNITWTPPLDDGGSRITNYEIEVTPVEQQQQQPSTNSEVAQQQQQDKIVITVDATTDSVVVSDLSSNTQYEIAVYAITAAGRSNATVSSNGGGSIIIFTTPNAPPADVTGSIAAGIAIPLILIIIFLVVVLILVVVIVATVVIVLLVKYGKIGTKQGTSKAPAVASVNRFTLDRPMTDEMAQI